MGGRGPKYGAPRNPPHFCRGLTCFLLENRSRASRVVVTLFLDFRIFSIFFQKNQNKTQILGRRKHVSDLGRPPYKGQSTGNHLYFPMVPFFCREHLPKSVEKVILLKKCLKLIDFSVGFFKITEPGITEKTDFQFLV